MYPSKSKGSKNGTVSKQTKQAVEEAKLRTVRYLERSKEKYEMKQPAENPRSEVIRSLGLGDVDGLLSYDDSVSELSEDSYEKLAADYDLLLNDVELLEAKEKLWNAERETLQKHISLLKQENEKLQNKIVELEARSDMKNSPVQPVPSTSSTTTATQFPAAASTQTPKLKPAGESCSDVTVDKTKQPEAAENPAAQQATKSSAEKGSKKAKQLQNGQPAQTESCAGGAKQNAKGWKKRPPVLIFIRPTPGHTYDEIFEAIEKCDELGGPIIVTRFRRVGNDVLLMNCKGSRDSALLETIVKKAIGDVGTVTIKTPMVTLTCTNLSELTVAEQLQKAILKQHGINVKLDNVQLKSSGNGVKRAWIRLAVRDGKKLDGKKLAIGISTVTFRTEMPKSPEEERCYRCTGLGHRVRECKEKHALCFRCGKDGHRASDCKNTPKCLVCKGEHQTGSRKCVQSSKAAESTSE
uniref:CCHC-type domain-containing protein n=1 Tax=Anopheles culicifacies TaxID=139723 RepID=A0A182LZ58_9DIPT